MVETRALAALEYAPEAGEFADLIAPPYDVVNAEMRQRLAAKNPYNIVRLSLPEADGLRDKYESAGRILEDWLAKAMLVRSEPAFYVIEQTFRVADKTLVRTGIFVQARLAPWGQGIYPHEVTLPKPKEDRMRLFRATRIVPGPTFSLFEDKTGTVRGLFRGIKLGKPYRTADGPEGSFDRIWKVTERGLLRKLQDAFAGEDFFIADGHHRYETALAYRDELALKGALPADHPANFVLTCAVPFDDPGLVILPTHRLLSLDEGADLDGILTALARDYRITPVSTLDAYGEAGKPVPSTVALYAAGKGYALEIKADARAAFARDAGPVMSAVNTYEVLVAVLPKFFGDVQRAIDEERIKYTHDLREAIEKVNARQFQAAVILGPMDVRTMANVASNGKVMPPKSTYFYPKLPTGAVIKTLD